MNHAPVSTTRRLPSASSITSVGWKSGSDEVRKSWSSVRNVAPSRWTICRCTRCGLNCALKRLPLYSGPNAEPRFLARAVRANTPDAGGQAFKFASVFCVDLEPVAAVGQIEQAVRSEKRAVQAGRVGGHLPSSDDDFFAPALAVEAEQIGRRGNI